MAKYKWSFANVGGVTRVRIQSAEKSQKNLRMCNFCCTFVAVLGTYHLNFIEKWQNTNGVLRTWAV